MDGWIGWVACRSSREPKVECRRLMDFDDAAKLKMSVLSVDRLGDGDCAKKKHSGNRHCALKKVLLLIS